VVALLAGQVALGVLPAATSLRHDFAGYYVAGRLVREGRPLDRVYERDWFQAQARRAGVAGLASFVPQPPPAALLLAPLAGAPLLAAKAVWTVVLAAAMLGSFFSLRGVLPVSGWLLGLIVLLPGWALANAFAYGQPYPLVLLALCTSLGALHSGRPFLAGLLLAPALAFKLYGIPFVLHLAWTRRWRALAGCAAGAVLLVAASVAAAGTTVHRIYLREVLPASLAGRIQDPYSTVWGSPASLAHRLFQHEPDLNPSPATDRPPLARALARGLPVAIVAVAVLAARRAASGRLAREWAAVALATLAASPLTASYHFVILVLPVAVLLAELPRPGPRAAVLGLLAFAGSPATHHFASLASGWGNLLAYPRLATVIALLILALAPLLGARRTVAAVLAGAAVAATAASSPAEARWQRIEEARGYLCAEPVACPRGLAWVEVAPTADRLAVRHPGGGLERGPGDTVAPRCGGGTLTFARAETGDPLAPRSADQDADSRAAVRVFVDRGSGELREAAGAGARVLYRGEPRRPRLSPDGSWVAFQAWEGGSWDVWAVERSSGRRVRVTSDPANEVEPDWTLSGDGIVFASDRRRGLGSTALYRVPFPP